MLIANVTSNATITTLKLKILSGTEVHVNNPMYSISTLVKDTGEESNVFRVYSEFTQVVTANGNVASVSNSKYIKEKNSLEQNPLVRLYTIYYPGEWYPPNAHGNPTGDGAGYSWPVSFPLRVAEVRGDFISDISYRVSMGEKTYVPYPINSGIIDTDSSGKIGETSITLANFDNIITDLIENPYIAGYSSNSTMAMVNGELLRGIDYRTVPGNTNYDANVVESRGGINIAFDYRTATSLGHSWIPLKADTRDLLGAIVEIKSTFANFLDVWPEHSVSTQRANAGLYLPLRSTLPYREGDSVANSTSEFAPSYKINSISATGIYFDSPATGVSDVFYSGSPVYIINPDRDSESYSVDRFKIDSLSSSDDKTSSFTLTNWLQYFKLQLPKRKFYKNTCGWVYKGPECNYPQTGTGNINNSSYTYTARAIVDNVYTSYQVTVSDRVATGLYNIRNEPVTDPDLDICAKNLDACKLRNNHIHFGGFPGTGRNMPR